MPATANKPHPAVEGGLIAHMPTCLTIRTFAKGQVLWREGAAQEPLYVICSGVVRAYGKSKSKRDSTEELARLGPGTSAPWGTRSWGRAAASGWQHRRPDFNGERGLMLREQGLELALALYQMRKLPPLRLAAILHRLAWCARERCADDVERTWLSQALEAYSQGYSETDLPRPRDELRLR